MILKHASKPEHVVGTLLEINQIEYQTEKTFEGMGAKRYDFYIPSMNTVIEVHGLQHYQEVPRFGNLTDQKTNDVMKKAFIESKGIGYVEVDARRSDVNFIMNNLLKTSFSFLVKDIEVETVENIVENKMNESHIRIDAKENKDIAKEMVEMLEAVRYANKMWFKHEDGYIKDEFILGRYILENSSVKNTSGIKEVTELMRYYIENVNELKTKIHSSLEGYISNMSETEVVFSKPKQLYEQYEKWCEDNGQAKETKKVFASKIEEHHNVINKITKINGASVRVYMKVN